MEEKSGKGSNPPIKTEAFIERYSKLVTSFKKFAFSQFFRNVLSAKPAEGCSGSQR